VGVSRFEIKFVLSEFNDNKFKLNNLFKCSIFSLIFVWKSTELESDIIMLISSVKIAGMEKLLKILAKSLMYISKRAKVQKLIPEGHHEKSYPSQNKH
jgi:hypothetical protein